MPISPFRYPYIESEVCTGLKDENSVYQMSSQLVDWIENELERRTIELRTQEGHPEISAYLTLRTFKKCPVFLMAYPSEDKKTVVEAWHFRMVQNEEGTGGLHLVLDRAPLKRLFKDLSPPKTDPPGPSSASTQA